VSVQLVGPFPLDLQKPEEGAGRVAASLRAEWSRAAHRGGLTELSASTAIPLASCPNLTAGVYGLWAPGDGATPARLALWVTLDASWMEAGPAPGVEQLPLAGALLEALAEVQWWGDAQDATLRPLVVLEWPPALAVRSAAPPAPPPAAPPPAAPLTLDAEAAPTIPPDDEPPLDLAEDPLAEAPPAPEVLVPLAPAPAAPVKPPALGDINFWDDELTAAPPAPRPAAPPPPVTPLSLEALPDLSLPDAAPPTPAPAPVETSSAPPPPRAPQLGLMTVMQGTLVMRRGVHTGEFTLVTPSPDDAPRPLADWLASPEGPCLVPGERVARPLSGWLSRELALQPESPTRALDGRLTEPSARALDGRLTRRVVQKPWRAMAQDAATSTLGVLLLALVVGAGAGLAADWSPAVAPTPDPPGLLPAISPCSADHAQFMEELRCQVAAMAPDGDDVEAKQAIKPRCRDFGAPKSEWVDQGGDLRPVYCGLLHRERDRWTGNFDDASTRGSRHNFAELAASQACFNVLGHPDDYKQPQNSALRLADPRRLLDDPTFRISSLGAVVEELGERCDGLSERLEAKVQGAVLVTHIGVGDAPLTELDEDADTRPCLTKGPDGERACMRAALTAVAARAVPSELRSCFAHGVTSGVRWGAGDALCGARDDRWSTESQQKKVWQGLAGTAKTGPVGNSPIQKYADARFVKTPAEKVSDPLWSCHLDLQNKQSWAPVEVAWGLKLPRPSQYDLGGAGVGTQLLLDAALSALNGGEQAGRCWGVVRGQLAAYSPVHPLLEELDPARWVSTEQQLCAQVCAARYNVTPTEHDARWWTRTSDLGVCTSGETPNPEAVLENVGLDALQLPWNWSWYQIVRTVRGPRPQKRAEEDGMIWRAADPAQICAFHLAAQERISTSDGRPLSGERSGESWAGAALEGSRIAGGKDGAAVRAIRGLELDKNYAHNRPVGAYGQEVCADVATQCFTTIMLETMAGRPRYQWVEGWQSAVAALPLRPIEDVFLDDPWCAAVHSYINSSAQGILELPCTQGVMQAEGTVKDALVTVSRRGTQ
jgi:hypothetical protein